MFVQIMVGWRIYIVFFDFIKFNKVMDMGDLFKLLVFGFFGMLGQVIGLQIYIVYKSYMFVVVFL